MQNIQAGILEDIPKNAKYLFYEHIHGSDPVDALVRLADIVDGINTVVGLGPSLLHKLGVEIPGLRGFPAQSATEIDIPSTPSALMCWLRGDDPGELLHRSRQINDLLSDSFLMVDCIDTFKFGAGQDLSGYEDGTENPTGQEAENTAFVKGAGAGLDGSSFVATQQWLHDFDALSAMSVEQADHCIGRRLSDNEELGDAPESAHVKRTAQEDFTPEAFVLRRSMPWSDTGLEGGLFFVAFGNSFDAFEAQLTRMIGAEDGITDALFQFTRPIGGAYYWCPPMNNGQLDLRALSLT